MRPASLSKKDADTLRLLYETGRYTYADLGRRFGVTYCTARNILQGRTKSCNDRKFDHPDEQAIYTLHLQGRTRAEIGAELGYPTAAITSFLIAQGLAPPMPPWVKPLPPFVPLAPIIPGADVANVSDTHLRRMHADELTPDEMQTRSGVDRYTIATRLRDMGLTPHKADWGINAFNAEVAKKMSGNWRKHGAGGLLFGKGTVSR